MTWRAVFDTNVVLSALLFSKGRLAGLRAIWAAGRVVPVAGRANLQELLRVLCYPKFRLTEGDRHELLSDYLPFVETVGDPIVACPVACRDADDQKFLDLAVTAGVDYLVTGDEDLLVLDGEVAFHILTPGDFMAMLEEGCR